ncbi:MAG: mercuric transporter MerT family protein [Fidelibacterota bacterium]
MKGTLVTSAVAGLAASLCCIGPALVVVGGATSLSMFSFLEPIRPYTSIAAVGLLAVAHVQVYRRKKEAACCDIHEEETMKREKIQRRTVWGITPVVLALILFPYTGSYLYAGGDKEKGDETLARAEWTVEGMTCQWCARGLEAGLNRVEGISKCTVDYESKAMVCTFDEKVVSSDAIPSVVKKMGYEAIPTEEKDQTKDGKKNGEPLTKGTS